jgi:hypothetical protein
MEQGWIYVLVNSSMPGLVKVGRTTRSAHERTAELSAATGVATPFVLAFEQEFADCEAAEHDVHAELERRGLRVAKNREFFRGSPAEIVRLVLDVAATPGVSRARHSAKTAPELLAEGERHHHGARETLQDLGEALRCYRIAAARGALVAHERLGAIYLHIGSPSQADRGRALRHLKDGVRRGNYFCYCEMAHMFLQDGHLENFGKAWEFFFDRRANAFLAEVEEGHDRYPAALRRYIVACLELDLPPRHLPELKAAVDALMHNLVDALDTVRDAPEARQRLATALRWSYENLLPELRSQPSVSRQVRFTWPWRKGWFMMSGGAVA